MSIPIRQRNRIISQISATLLIIASTGCSSMSSTRDFRTVSSISEKEIQTIRREKKDVILSNPALGNPTGIIIKMVGIDAKTGQTTLYLLDLCTGTLTNTLGQTVYQYPGEWGGSDC